MGDTIKEIDGYAVLSERDLTFALALADPEAVSMEVERQGRRVDLGTFPLHTQTLEDGSQMVTLDFYVQPEEVTVLSVLRRGVTDTLSMARMVWETLSGMVTGRFGLNDLAGAHRHGPGHHPGGQRRAFPELRPGSAEHPHHHGDAYREPGDRQPAAPARVRRRQAAVSCVGRDHPPAGAPEVRGVRPRRGVCAAAGIDGGGGL